MLTPADARGAYRASLRRAAAVGTPAMRAYAEAVLAGREPPPPPPDPVAAAAPCAHLGGPVLGDGVQATRPCPTCRGTVMLKVFTCGHPGHASDPTTTLPGCGACPDYAAAAP